MKPTLVGSNCQRVQEAVDEALCEGTLSLSPELSAHVARCARCHTEVTETEQMLARLRGAVAAIDLGQVPRVVDYVLAHTAAEPHAMEVTVRSRPPKQKQKVSPFWVLGQIAAVAAVLVLTVSGLTFAALKVNEVVSGVKPGDALQRLAAPFSETNRANLRGGK